MLVFRGTISLSQGIAPRLAIRVRRLQGRVRYGKLILPPSDWLTRTPLTRFLSLIGRRSTPPPHLGSRLLCVPGRRAQLLRLSSPSGLDWASSSAHCSASRAPGIFPSPSRVGSILGKSSLPRPMFSFPYWINFRLGRVVAAAGRGERPGTEPRFSWGRGLSVQANVEDQLSQD